MSSSSTLPEAFARLLECPVCLAIPVGRRIFSCSNGHNVCEDCFGNLGGRRPACPLGRCAFGWPAARNRTVEDMVELHDPAKTCSTAGCGHRGSADAVAAHESTCEAFGDAVDCWERGCPARPRLRHLVTHLKEAHGEAEVALPAGGLVCRLQVFLLDGHAWCTPPTLVAAADGTRFVCGAFVREGCILYAHVAAPTAPPPRSSDAT